MARNTHIRRINDTWVNVLAGLDDGQTALLTNAGNEHVHRIGTNYFFETPSQHWTGAAWVYHDVIYKDIFSTNDIFVTRYIAHYGDSDTRRYFQNDRITDTVGGVDFVDMVEVAGQDYIEFNPAEEDIDHIINTTLPNTIFVEGNTGNVGFGIDPSVDFHTARSNGDNIHCLDTYDDGATYTRLRLRKSDSDTLGAQAQTDSGDYLGEIAFYGVNNTGPAWALGAIIYARQDGAAIGDVPTNLIFETCSAITQNTNQFVLHNDGFIGFGTDTPVSLVELYSATAHPILTITGDHATNYDPQTQLRKNAGVLWSYGMDSATDNFIITPTAGVAGQTHWNMDTAGNVGINVAPSTSNKLYTYALSTDVSYNAFRADVHGFSTGGEHTYNAGNYFAYGYITDGDRNFGTLRGIYVVSRIVGSGVTYDGQWDQLYGAQIDYGIANTTAAYLKNARGLYITLRAQGTGPAIDSSYDIQIGAKLGGQAVNNEWCINSSHTAPSRFADSVSIAADISTTHNWFGAGEGADNTYAGDSGWGDNGARMIIDVDLRGATGRSLNIINGDLGVGLAAGVAPSAKLQIHDDGVDVNVDGLKLTGDGNYFAMINTAREDTDTGRETRLKFKGTQSGGEVTTLAEIRVQHDGDENDEKGRMRFRVNAGNDGTAPTERMGIAAIGDVSTTKTMQTVEGGFAVLLTNKSGGALTKGRVVEASSTTDDAFTINSEDGNHPIGVVYDDSIEDNATGWIVGHGIADVVMDDNTLAGHGHWVYTSEAGYSNATIADPPGGGVPELDIHMREVGHCIESVAAGGGGTHILARCYIHLN